MRQRVKNINVPTWVAFDPPPPQRNQVAALVMRHLKWRLFSDMTQKHRVSLLPLLKSIRFFISAYIIIRDIGKYVE